AVLIDGEWPPIADVSLPRLDRTSQFFEQRHRCAPSGKPGDRSFGSLHRFEERVQAIAAKVWGGDDADLDSHRTRTSSKTADNARMAWGIRGPYHHISLPSMGRAGA